MSNTATPAPWSISEVRTVEGEYMVVGGVGQEFGLIASCPEKADAELIVRLRGSGVLTEEEHHAVGVARYQVADSTPADPDCCFDYQLVGTLLGIIDRAAPSLPEKAEGREAVIEECASVEVRGDVETEAQAINPFQEGYAVGYQDTVYRFRQAIRALALPSADQCCPVSGKPCDCIVTCSLPSTHRGSDE